MELPPRITLEPPVYRSQDFEFLRSEGLAVIQALATKSWTDHNLHDPGITLLEAICYALTEAGLRSEMDVKDLLASSSAFRRPELFTAAQVLPGAPVTAVDMRKIFIDHPLINNAWLFPILPVPRGRSSVLLEFADDALNSNVFLEEVSPPTLTDTYRVALAFPHWDDDDVRAFREDVTLQSITFSGPPGSEWNDIEGSTSFFTRATVTVQPPVGGPQAQELWIVVQILSEMDDAAVEAPLVLQEVTTLVSDLGNNGLLKNLNRRVTQAFEAMRLIRRYAQPYRNLCEDFAEFNAVRLQEVAVSAIIEVGSGVAIEELLAEVFYRVDHLISPLIRFESLDARLEQEGSADAVFDGPLTDSGFLAGSVLGAQQITHTLYTSDILRLIYQLRREDNADVQQREDVTARRIVAVRSLSLSNYIDNRPITTGARDCLQLVRSHRHVPRLSVSRSRIVTYRNGIEVSYDASRVLELFAEKKAADVQTSTPSSRDIPVPAGESYPVGDYYPIQNDLPIVYGVGEAGLPDYVPASRRAQARQLKGYLFLYEQMLAGFQAQLVQFNTFFSADPDVEQTLFQQTLYHLPNIAPLFRAFDAASTTWSDFQNDNANAYARVLRNAVETPEQFLERRNAVLDHLLGTFGEDMRDRSALLLRMAAQVPGDSSLPLPVLLQATKQRRLDALRALIQDKSAYYYDVPALNRNKGQAFGHLLRRRTDLLEISTVAGAYEWQITDASGTPLFRQFAPAASVMEARRMAEQVMKLATSTDRYTIRVESGGARRLEVRSHATADPLGESVDTYATAPQAQAAITTTAGTVVDLWTRFALIPLESRLYHLLGIDVKERRRLLHDVDDYAEVFDNPTPNPNNEKLFRIWELSGFSGDQLLESVDVYPGPTDAAATADARAAAQQVIEQGIHPENYRVENPAPGTFRVVLVDPAANPLARSPQSFTSEGLAKAEVDRIQAHLYALFSLHGLYLIEHHLLFPADTTDTALQIPGQSDPYSFQLTVILPSGSGRDFTQATIVREPVEPALYRNGEFRRYTEQQVRKFCPAHILPRVLWVDRALPGTPVGPGDASFDALEQAYHTWLRAFLEDEIDETTLRTRRNTLTTVLNALYQAL